MNLENLVQRLAKVRGIEAVVLGGSRARGTHGPNSDYDLGLYYHPDRPIDLPALEQVAREVDDQHRSNLINEIGGWGPWINGGGWLTVEGTAVDFLYRDLTKVEAVIEECRSGSVRIDYQPGHPQGFLSAIYLGEAAVCQPLHDPNGTIARLKSLVFPYPPKLKQAIISKFFWEVDFSLGIGKKGVQRSDSSYVAGCCFRAVVCMAQTLFALNEAYWLNEKGAVAMIESFTHKPDGWQSHIDSAFAQLSNGPEGMLAGIEQLKELEQEIAKLIHV